MSEFDATIGGLPGAPLPALGTDFAIVSRDGVQLTQIQLRNWPVSNPMLQAIATRLGPTDLATINGQSLIQPGGNIVIATGGGSGGTATWGDITGTLSDQTDLQTALNGRATAAQGILADSALQPDDIGISVQWYDPATAKTNLDQNFTQTNRFIKTFTVWQAETFLPVQTLEASLPAGTTTLTGNMTLNAVSNSNANEMQVIVRAFTQDATGGRTIAYNTSVFSAGAAIFPQPTPTANRVSLFQFTKMPDGKWVVQSLNDVRSS